jgi:hypothetical protein
MQYVHTIKFNGLSGREFEFKSTGEAVTRGRVVFIKTRLYQWQAVT